MSGRGYDLEEKMATAIKTLEEDELIVTDLQLFGSLGVSDFYYYGKMANHSNYGTIEALLSRNRSKMSKACTKGLIDRVGKGSERAMETLGKITDKQIREALHPPKNQVIIEQNLDEVNVDELMNEISGLIEKNNIRIG